MRTLKICVVMLMLAGVGLVSSLPAFAQVQEAALEPSGEVGLFTPMLKVSKSLEPKKESKKMDFLFNASSVYLLGGTVVDMTTTARFMNRPNIARRPDGTVITSYYSVETGWAKCFGEKNTTAIVVANVALNVGLNLLSRKLYHRGGHWRILAIGVNVLKGTDNLVSGIRNTGYNTDADRRLVGATGYTGPVIWSH